MALAVILAIVWFSRLSERGLQRLAARRPQQFSAASAYALGRIGRYLLLAIGAVLAFETAGIGAAGLLLPLNCVMDGAAADMTSPLQGSRRVARPNYL